MQEAIAHEWRQFRRLVRLSYGRMLDAALASREIDAAQFVIWGGALLTTPPLFSVLKMTSGYPWLRHRSLEALQNTALEHRIFFIIWAMLAAMLLAALVWDGLFPDRTDQQVLGVLPVRSHTVALARVWAALVVAFLFIAAISTPAAVLYAVFGAVHPIIGSRTGVLVGHLLSTVAAGMFTFCVLLTLRGVLVFSVGAAAAARAALLLQLVTVLLLVETFLFLPGLLPAVLHPLLTPGVAAGSWLPPAWFLGLYSAFGGPRAAVLAVLAPTAVVATATACGAAFLVYVLPARWNARRAIEARSSDRTGHLGAWLTSAATSFVIAPAARAVIAFTLRSLARNTRPLLIVSTWLGLGLAVAGLRLVSASVGGHPLPLDVPADYLLALPLVLTFCLVGGLRAAFAVPIDVQANWSFRLTAGRASTACVNAVRATLWLLAVAPITTTVLVGGSWMWGLTPALMAAVMHVASGAFLCELAVFDCRTIPFTRGRGLSSTTLKVGAPLALLGLCLYAFTLADLQVLALRSWNGTAIYLATAGLATIIIGIAGHRRQRQQAAISFDAPADESLTGLRLSGATG